MKMKAFLRSVVFLWTTIVLHGCSTQESESARIDRYKLVSRHNVVLTKADTLGSLSVGNGEFAFTVDVSGLQTFRGEYENGIPLGTQSQWGWHSTPSERNYTLNDVAEEFKSCDSTKAPYAVQQSEGEGKEASDMLRANPHRLHLGIIGLILLKEDGNEVKLEELSEIHQELDLWTGGIESTYKVDGNPVKVTLYGHQQKDRISAKIESSLIKKERLRIEFDFPYGNSCHVCPGYDWQNTEKHQSKEQLSRDRQSVIKHELDSTTYFAHIAWNGEGNLNRLQGKHTYVLTPSRRDDTFEFTVTFAQDSVFEKSDFNSTKAIALSIGNNSGHLALLLIFLNVLIHERMSWRGV